MYLPDVFLGKAEHMFALLRDHPLTTLIVHGDAVPHIAHVPLLARADHTTLLGHVASRNPLVRDIDAGASATVVVHGPDAYVSPTMYLTSVGHVPTWNYAVAHVQGRLIRASDQVNTLDNLVAAFEGEDAYRPDWTDSNVSALTAHIVCFELVIETIDVKLKLSQNRHPQDFDSAAAYLARGGRSELVRWMKLAQLK